MDLLHPDRVLDVGCGRGIWLRAFQEEGVQCISGIDGAYLREEQLVIPKTAFRPVDLRLPFELDERYDLAICLEVVEHLPGRAAAQIVKALTKAAPIVLFSAALPGQGGTDHVNEQWPHYWERRFAKFGFKPIDAIRPLIWRNIEVEWWYRQNILFYASPQAIADSPLLQAEEECTRACEMRIVHKDILEQHMHVRGSLRSLRHTVVQSLKRRLRACRKRGEISHGS